MRQWVEFAQAKFGRNTPVKKRADLVFYAAVLAFSVLSYGDQVDPLVARLNPLDGPTRTDIGIQIEHSESQEHKLINQHRGLANLLNVRFSETAPLPI